MKPWDAWERRADSLSGQLEMAQTARDYAQTRADGGADNAADPTQYQQKLWHQGYGFAMQCMADYLDGWASEIEKELAPPHADTRPEYEPQN